MDKTMMMKRVDEKRLEELVRRMVDRAIIKRRGEKISAGRHEHLVAGQKFEHRDRGGRVLARCTYTGDGYRYRGRKYSSISAAANAAAETLGMKSRTLNGWVFWGVERRGTVMEEAPAVSASTVH